jgi:hypothetical protein
MLKKSFKVFKKKFFYFLLFDFLFIFLSFIFLFYIRKKLQGYLILMQQFSSQLTTENLILLENVLPNLNTVVQRALVYIYLIPVVIFILFCIFQSINFRLIYGDKILDIRNSLKFSLVSLPFFVFLSCFILKFDLIFILITLLIGYFTLNSYSFLKDKLNEIVKKTFKIGLRRIYLFFPLYIVFLILIFLLFVFIFMIYVNLMAETLTVSNLLVNFVFLIVILIIIIWFRIIFVLGCGRQGSNLCRH